MKGNVSVVIPCYNSGKTLERAIESILHQSMPAFEIIVINDSSSDPETISILQSVSNSIVKVIHHEINQGLPQTRNTGFLNALGDLVLFLDADDYFEPTAIEEMVLAIPKGENKFFIYTDIIFRGDRSGFSERKYLPFSQLMRNSFPYSILIPRASVNWGNPYRKELRMGLEDWDFSLTLLEREFVPVRIPKPLFNYSVDINGMFAQITENHFFSIWEEIRKRHSSMYTFSNLFVLFKRERQEPSSVFPLLSLILLAISLMHFPKFFDILFSFQRKFSRFFSKVRGNQ